MCRRSLSDLNTHPYVRPSSKITSNMVDYLLKSKAVGVYSDPENLPKKQRSISTDMWPEIRFPDIHKDAGKIHEAKSEGSLKF